MKKLHNKAYAVELAHRRAEHELDRKKRRRARRQQGTRVARLPVIHAKSVNVLMNFLRQSFQGKNLATFDDKNSMWILNIPQVFSFIKNPQETLDTIFSLVEISKHQKISREFSLFIDHAQLKEMDKQQDLLRERVGVDDDEIVRFG